jgi:signal transduction histidine kinase
LLGLRHLNNESSRLSALLIGLFAAAALLLGATVYFIAERAMRAELHDFISADTGAVESGFRSEGLPEAIEVVQQLTAVPGVSGRYLLQTRDGHRLAGNLAPMTPRAGLFEVRLAGQQARVLGEGSYLPDGSYLFVGENTARVANTRALILGSFAWIIGATLALAIAGGALLSAGFLRRVDAITRTCRAVVAGRFGERIPVSGTSGQLDRLSASINEMLDRISTLLESLRQVSSDIAHDLRTPLTRLRQRLQAAQGKAGSAEDHAQLIDRALQDCDTILAVFGALLRISQIESGMRLASFAPVRLTALLREVAELYAPVAEDGQQRLRTELNDAVSVHADRMLLMQMFSNLVENAIRHAGPGATIRLHCDREGDEACVRVIDSGPGIPAAERDKVFGRLYRLERSRNTPGNGLGLALVAAIVKLHQYRIELSDARPGLCVTLRIPLREGLSDSTNDQEGKAGMINTDAATAGSGLPSASISHT